MNETKEKMRDKELLNNLKTATKKTEVEDLIEDLDLKWKPLGGRENVGTVRSGSSPTQALVERITNGIDAILDRAVHENELEKKPSSPREAVTKLFGLSEGGYNDMDQSWVRDTAQTNLRVNMQESGVKELPTIEIQDRGIGQKPPDFEKTFLSLNEDNKVDRPYLIGKYGQGGSNTFEFCEYAIIISRHVDGGDAGWSIVRYNPRTGAGQENYTDGIFQYCVKPDGSVPSINGKYLDGWEGSRVRLIEYDGADFCNILGPGKNTLYTVVHKLMFGSIFPISVEDHRVKRFSYNGSPRKRTVVGSRYRLDQPDSPVDESREFNKIPVDEFGTVQLKYWVLENTDDVEQFVDKTEPIVFTHHGQKHHTEHKRLFKKTGYTFLKDRIIIEINCDQLNQQGKRIFSSTRDRASKGDAYRTIKERVYESLNNDKLLEELNEKYQERALNDRSSEQEEKTKDLLADLLQEPDETGTGEAKTDGGDGKNGKGKNEGDTEKGREPITPRHKYPTYIEIDNKSDPIKAKQGKTMYVRVCLDADDDFERLGRGEVNLEWDNNLDEVLELLNETALDKGWKIFQIQVSEDAKVDLTGELSVSVEWPNGRKSDNQQVIVTDPPESTGGSEEVSQEAPEIQYVYKDDTQTRETLDGWQEDDAVVEYSPEGDGSGTVFVALFNENIQPIRETNDTENILESRDRQYAAYISYYEITRYRELNKTEAEEPDEEYVNQEKNRIATTLMRSISEGLSPEKLGVI